MTVSFRDARDFTIWFDAWIEGKKKLTEKEVSRLKEMVHAIPLEASVMVVPQSSKVGQPAAPAPKPKPSYPFVIDREGYARNGRTNARVLAKDVTDTLYDLRGMDGSMSGIVWADESTGLNGADLNIVAA